MANAVRLARMACVLAARRDSTASLSRRRCSPIKGASARLWQRQRSGSCGTATLSDLPAGSFYSFPP